MTICYLDSSALVKLVTDEVESAALRQHLVLCSTLLTSRVATVEVPRAVARKGGESVALVSGLLVEALESVSMMELDAGIATQAAELLPATLRSLDAIHLASALAMGSELDEVVTYDMRFAEAARVEGLAVTAPA